jgi:hypothetical protein
MGLRDKIVSGLPWIEPVLDYFDWRKRVVALVAAIGLAVWSYVKDLPWPVIVVLATASFVIVAYALLFPAFLKLVHVGVNPRPNNAIWRHKTEFAVIQAAFLLADCEPRWDAAALSGDAAAWYGVLSEAIQKKEISYIPSDYDARHTDRSGRFTPQTYTLISATELKKFCDARDRHPEFLP